MANPNVSSLPQWVAANADQLLYKAATGAKTIRNIRVQPGIWGKGAINVVTPSIVFNGSPCGFNDTSAAVVSQREITTGLLVVNATFCDDAVINTYLEQKFNNNGRISDGEFFEKFVGSYIEAVHRQLDILVWRGDTAASSNNNFDGLLKGIAADAAATSAGALPTGTSQTPTAVFNFVLNNVVANIDPEIIGNGRGIVFMGEDLYSKFIVGMTAANLYHYAPEDVANGVVIAGTNIRAVGVAGLTGQNKIVAGDRDNFVFGTGFDTDRPAEQFRFIFDEADNVWKLIIRFTGGVNTIFPDKIVVSA